DRAADVRGITRAARGAGEAIAVRRSRQWAIIAAPCRRDRYRCKALAGIRVHELCDRPGNDRGLVVVHRYSERACGLGKPVRYRIDDRTGPYGEISRAHRAIAR